MSVAEGLQVATIRGLRFFHRPGFSDEKAIREVVGRRAYQRRDFPAPRRGETWLDLGANVGAFSVWAGSLGAHVEAYEPDPESYAMADRNVRLNRLENVVRLYPAAVVGDGRRSATLHTNEARGNVWRNSLERTWAGGRDIEVACVSARSLWRPGVCVKMDVEGSEMPILERLADQPVRRLVFEWSFDVDPSISRFEAVIARLRGTYRHVVYAGYLPGYAVWPGSWQPPARMVWCW
jgi:FkbM family methyltransferase